MAADNVNNTSSPIAGPDDKTTDIRAAMSVSNLLTPPAQGFDLPDPSSPVPTQADVADAVVGAQDVIGSPASTGNVSPKAEISSAADETVIDKVIDNKVPISTSSPTDTPSKPEFICLNDEYAQCKTGQHTKDLSRKVISDHFGRNKACTRLITDWPLFCRKHYQRATYNGRLWQVRKVNLILRQFDVIERQIPGTKYTIALKKSEETRLNTYSRKVASGSAPVEAAATVEPENGGKHFEAPIDVLRELEYHLGPNKTINEAKDTINLIQDMLQQQETKQVPSIEFLPQIDNEGHPYSVTLGRSKARARVSKKGGIQKTSTKKTASKAKAKAKA